jgi:ribonuclease HI
MKPVIIYTDGACIGNPGPGGYGVVLSYKERRKELSAGLRLTTNNRMEIIACIAGLSSLKEPCDVALYSDSKYVVDAVSKSWVLKWRRNGWKRKDPNSGVKEVLNQDLWLQVLDLCEKHRVEFNWVRGHAGNKLNERCDELARAAARLPSLGIDLAFENNQRLRQRS